MSELKRYVDVAWVNNDHDPSDFNSLPAKSAMVEAECGEYVKYEDAKELTAELARTKAMLEVAEKGLRDGVVAEHTISARNIAYEALAQINKMKGE